MKAIVSSSEISGRVQIPASKSAMQRACALALLNNGQTLIQNAGNSEDDTAALNIIQSLGALVKFENSSVVVHSNGIVNPLSSINCNESGLSLRMFTPLVALSSKEVTITGNGSLLKRKIDLFETIFQQLNVKINSTNGYLPLTLKGPMQLTAIEMDGSKSSQYLTGILFAFAKCADKPYKIHCNNLVSKPYIDMSLKMLQDFGYQVTHHDYKVFVVHPKVDETADYQITIEGDWSSASFFIAAAVIAGDLSISGLDIDSDQSDKKILKLLQHLKVDFNFENDCLSVKKSDSLLPFEFDATDCPDLFPPLVVLALHAQGKSVIKGVNRLFDKESNRAETLVNEFSKMGADIKVSDDSMVITGGKKLSGVNVSSHNDHRIAMALAIAGLNINGQITIDNAASVRKSFPAFFKLLKDCGGVVSLTEEQ